ncbi:MAG: ABC transporter permease subunit [Bacillota bacterium]|nr:sugar ABC transporter permease [Bacillota bacterium]
MMVFIFVVWVIIFRYVPLWGWLMAFQDYKPWKPITDQQWVGLQQFVELFKDRDFYRAMRNTLAMSFLGLAIGFPIPILLALLINELGNKRFKRIVQTVSYLPHFVSWVVIASIVFRILSPLGVVNNILLSLGVIDQAIAFMGEPKYFWWIVVFTDLWKEMGWNSIVYLAAIAGISPELYEAATIDGAGRFRKMWHITLPGIMPTIVVLLVLSIGNIINIGFERQFLLRTASTRDVADVIDLYILNYGLGTGRYSFGTAAGVFKSVVSLVLLTLANSLSKKLTGYRVI